MAVNKKIYDDYCAICGAPVRIHETGARCDECGQVFCENHYDKDAAFDGCDKHQVLT